MMESEIRIDIAFLKRVVEKCFDPIIEKLEEIREILQERKDTPQIKRQITVTIKHIRKIIDDLTYNILAHYLGFLGITASMARLIKICKKEENGKEGE